MPKTGDGGFILNRRMFRLTFEGELDGLVVVCRSASVVVYQEIAELADRDFANPPNAGDRAALAGLYAGFASILAGWNLREPADDAPDAAMVPVPATLAGVKSQEPGFINTLVTAWLDAVASVLSATTEHLDNMPDGQMEGLLADASLAGPPDALPLEVLESELTEGANA